MRLIHLITVTTYTSMDFSKIVNIHRDTQVFAHLSQFLDTLFASSN